MQHYLSTIKEELLSIPTFQQLCKTPHPLFTVFCPSCHQLSNTLCTSVSISGALVFLADLSHVDGGAGGTGQRCAYRKRLARCWGHKWKSVKKKKQRSLGHVKDCGVKNKSGGRERWNIWMWEKLLGAAVLWQAN